MAEEKKLTAEALRKQAEAIDELKKQGDEQMLGKLEEVMKAASDIDVDAFLSELSKIAQDEN
ncbi:MAG TPA: hypothetical protein DGX96_03910 [Lachnospiraceae bacterium]|jgi:esterase/lipase superfamily enzyme|nr:hypothetical protein [Lachnospiraceae bacterium]